ncbi:MAG: ABC transporter substrate-binding protein [Gammaproteobacteria bacterium]|nr:ABC transporter substrate-binding protein [Gammaproteobacteria bacterium]
MRASHLCSLLMLTAVLLPVDAENIRVGYLVETRDPPPVLSNLDDPPEDEGVAGAVLGISDNNSTGKFSGQGYNLEVRHIDQGEDPKTALASMATDGIRFVLLDLETDTLLRLLQQPVPNHLLMFNIAAQDRRLRDSDCHASLLHTALSRDMRSDALAQLLLKKRWKRWFLVAGHRAGDEKFAAAVKRSAKKFGARIVAQKDWSGDFDARRSAPAEVPLFTQGPDYDVLMVADESGDFGDYLLFNTWDPRPVAGTQGLVAKTWGRPVEQWGAAQLQERFLKQANRWMMPRDYAAWLAVRSIGEARLRNPDATSSGIEGYIRSEKFQLAGYKGRKMNYRRWNGQMRQPVPIMWARALVSQAPLEEFLHQRNELDTLGLDRADSRCKLN